MGCKHDICISIKDAHSIMKVLEHLACIGDDCGKEARDIYWAILYDCAKREYSCGFVPSDPFDENCCSPADIIRGIRN